MFFKFAKIYILYGLVYKIINQKAAFLNEKF